MKVSGQTGELQLFDIKPGCVDGDIVPVSG
jgi:hypothetical protein